MSFFKFVLAPKLYKEYGIGDHQKLYESSGLEKWGDQIISTLSLMWNISYYTSPLIVGFLYRRGYFVAESIITLAKFTTGIGLLVAISLCMRGLGRSKSSSYARLVKALELTKSDKTLEEGKKQLRKFDFEFHAWRVDFDVADIDADDNKPVTNKKLQRPKSIWTSSLPCEIAAYIAIHSFGLSMIYPGSVKLLQHYFRPILVQGRAVLIEEHQGKRNKVKTNDGNEIDTMFIDNRSNETNGKILVICSEGNAGFYENGIMSTPMSLNYSVLGWNHPGFAGSSGLPFPSQEQNAIDGVIKFAIHKLQFKPESIILFGWSIGGYNSLWGGVQYPEIKGVVLDAVFDDILHLALPRMPQILSSVVKIAIRDHFNLNNSQLMNDFAGPVLLIRRTDDEVIAEDNRIETNRGNFLCLSLLKYRFPNIFDGTQMANARYLLAKPLEKNAKKASDEICLSRLISYASEAGKQYPLLIGEDFDDKKRSEMASYLVRQHFRDFKSSHCTPLPNEFFTIPWDIPIENGFVFT